MRRSLGCALVPDVNLAGVNLEGAHVLVPAVWRLRAVSTRITVNDFRACSSEIDKKGENNFRLVLGRL